MNRLARRMRDGKIGRGGLAALRRRVDRLDRKIIALLLERNRLAKRILALKRRQDLPLYCAEREREILASVRRSAGGRENETLIRIFKMILRQFVAPPRAKCGSQGRRR